MPTNEKALDGAHPGLKSIAEKLCKGNTCNPLESPEKPFRKGGRKPPTIVENIKQKAERHLRWIEANPGVKWENQAYDPNDEKIFIQKDLLKNQAFRSLSRVAMLLYLDFLERRIMTKDKKTKKWMCHNNGNIVFTYKQAMALGYSENQFRDGVDELQGKGLLDIKHKGKGGRKPEKGTGDVTKYWIDDRWLDYGTEKFKPARNPRVKDTRKDRGFALLMSDPKRKKEIISKRKKIIPTVQMNRR